MTGQFAEFNLSSGFVVHVKALPPYYKDFIEDAIPLVPIPKRILHLLAGDDIPVEYIVPETFPEESEEQELYLLHNSAVTQNAGIEKLRDKARMSFLLLNCVEIVSGPIEESDKSWVERLEFSLPNYKVPTDPSLHRIAFLKSQVITSQPEMEAILAAALFVEVDMQGILSALHNFQDTISRTIVAGGNTVTSGK